MVRRSIVAAILAIVVFPTTMAFAQAPDGDTDPRDRTPRVPRQPSTDHEEPSTVVTAPPRSADTGGASEVGTTPPAPSGIARSRVRSHIDTDQQAIALTLDDGYDPDHSILDLIARYGVHGTAFIVGDVADADPAFVRELAGLGWTVCSHTQSHAQLTTLSYAQIREEMLDGIESVENVVGYRCPHFRAPFGSVDSRVAAIADELGVQVIGWDASISDSAPAGTEADLQTKIAIDAIRPGSILLGHFGGTNSFTVLAEVLEWLRTSGYRVGSISELIDGTTRPLPDPADARSGVADVPVGAPLAGTTRRAPFGVTPVRAALYGAAIGFLFSLAWGGVAGRRQQRRVSQAQPSLDPL